MRIFNKVLSLLLLSLVLTGCQAVQFHSVQWNTVMDIRDARREQERSLEELAWILTWNNEQHTLFPIITPETGRVDFMNDSGSIMVSYLRQQVIAAHGLLPLGQNVEIERNELGGLEYEIDANIVSRNNCEPIGYTMDGDMTIWRQPCRSPEGDYSNEIRVNGDGLVEYLSFTILPGYPPLRLVSNMATREY